MGKAHAQTLDHTLVLKAGYTVVEMWECEFELLLKADGEMRDFVARVLVLEKLEPRDAFFYWANECSQTALQGKVGCAH